MVYFFIFCVLALEGMNEIVFGGGIRGRNQKTTACLKGYICQGILFICSRITFAMVYSFYFLCFGSGRNECNSIWGERWGRGQKVVAYSDTVSAMLSMMIR